MGRAIVRDPQVFLFDEPLSNLDAKLRVSMRGEIKALHQRLATTTVYVTHDQIEAMTMADKIVVMHDGIVEQIGAPLDLYDRPANLFVAGFIGSPAMNILEGQLDGSGFALGGLTLPVKNAPAASVGRPAYYGIRPEHFRLTGDGIPVEVIITGTHRLGDAGAGQSRGAAADVRVPGAGERGAGRDHPCGPRSGPGPPVRQGKRPAPQLGSSAWPEVGQPFAVAAAPMPRDWRRQPAMRDCCSRLKSPSCVYREGSCT
jgi:energy-coupling factor transporter ATP-binding protein EcfA2